ncbi:putative ribonuclease H-like domain-containing protein [Tanacetum coccineum]
MSGEEPATQIAPVESPQMVSTVKLPILKKGEYTLWSMRMEQYLTNTDYSLWQVILNGDGPIQVTTDENGVETEVPPKTAQALLARQRERKAKSILLLAIPDEYQLRFHAIKDAKTLWAAIKSRFGALPSSWNNVALIMRNKAGIDDLDIDDLYNNLKVFEADIKGSSGSFSNSQNVAFLFTEDTSSSNEPSSPQLDDEDLEQIYHDDLEEIDLKWQVAMLSMRVKRFYKKTRRKLIFNGKETVGFDKTKVECFNCHRRGHFARECKAPRNQGNMNRDAGYRSRDNTKRTVPVETSDTLVVQDNALIVKDGLGYDWSYVAQDEPTEFSLMAYTLNSSGSDTELGLESVEAQLVVYQKNEAFYEEKIIVLEFEVKDKRYGDQLNENDSSSSELFNSVFDSRSSDGDDNQTNDRFKKDNAYHVVPPPLTGNYMPPLADLSFAGLDDSVYRPTTNKTSASVSQVEASTSQTSNTSVEMPRVESVRPSGVIIEDWVSDDEDIFQSNDLQATDKPSFKRIEFTNARNESVKPKQAKKPRMITQNPKVDRRAWNGQMTQKLGLGFGFTKKACFVCGSYSHLIKDCDFHEKRMAKSVLKDMGKVAGHKEVRPVWNNTQRINHQNKFIPSAVLTRFRRVLFSAAKQSSFRATSTSAVKQVNTATDTNRVNISKTRTNTFHKSHSPIRRPFHKSTAPNTSISNEIVNTVRVKGVNTAGQTAVSAVKGNGVTAVKASAGCVWRPKMTDLNNVSKDNSGSWVSKRGNPQQALKNKGIFDSGCSRHMTGNKDFLTDYQDIDGGFVAFGGGTRGGKITGKGKIRTDKLDFEDVFFVKELNFNLFSVSQMCDKKNNVLFTETECLVLSPDFKLLDENQVLLRVPRQSNMYNFDLRNVVPSGDLTCLFANATIDESKLWHRRMGHVNFKTMNKLVKGNLVRGKIFVNDHTCVACQKGKQHKASCKTKLVSSISQPLQMLHMDLFGPTSVRSINHKTYCLVVTDDFSRFSWVFFLASKDETSGILKRFIIEIENQLNHKVKVIRCDNGTEFKNREMNELCGLKGIKREFSVARTPQQNGVAERKNRTLIEAARTMLADSLLPTVFWAEAVNTACYVLNRVLVTKPHNKTPYELIIGRPPSISFMRPFGCPVTILNTLDPLGKFDGKAEEGFLVGYSVNSKAFRVFNSQTRKVEENLHVNFLENKPNVAGQGPNWLFDIDSLTNSMNYQPKNVYAGQSEEKNVSTQQYIMFPLWSSISSSNKSSDETDEDDTADDAAGEKPVQKPASENEQALKNVLDKMMDQEKEAKEQSDTVRKEFKAQCNRQNLLGKTTRASSTNSFNTVSTLVNTAGASRIFSDAGSSFIPLSKFTNLPHDPLMPDLEDTVEADFNNMEPSTVFGPIPTTRVNSIHPKDQIIGDPRIEAIRLFLAYASFMNFLMYQMDVKSAFLYGTIKEELLELGMDSLLPILMDMDLRGQIDKTLFIKRVKGDILLVQVYVDDIIFGSTRKSLCTNFEQIMHKRFQMSSMGELTFFLGLQVKQKDDGIFISQDKYVGEILKKFGFSSIRTASTPMETNKALTKDGRKILCSLFVLAQDFKFNQKFPISFSDSDYAGASLDRKSTTGGCQFLGSRLISWQCKKQIVVANSTTEAENIASSHCCGQVLWIQNQLLDYGYNFMHTKIHVDNESVICVVKNPVYHSKTKHIEIRHHFI